MTPEQNKLMEMVDEINSIAEKNNLQYVLEGKTAGAAIKYKGFVSDECEFSIHMPFKDAILFRDYVFENLSETRTIEYWGNSNKLYRMLFRYVNKETLFIDETTGKDYSMPGIAVDIYVARTSNPSDELLNSERYLMDINNAGIKAIDINNYSLPVLFKNINPSERTKWVENQYEELEKKSDSSDFWYMYLNGNKVKLPKDLFKSTEMRFFAGRKVPVTKHMEEYMCIVVGKTWKRKIDSIKSPKNNNAILSLDVSYEDYLDFIKNDDISFSEILFQRRCYNEWKEKEYRPLAKRVSETWTLVKCSVEQIDVWADLEFKRDILKADYEQGNYENLEKSLEKYLRNTETFFKKNIGFYIDAELFCYAQYIWRKHGTPEFGDEVLRIVPPYFKKRDIGKYIYHSCKDRLGAIDFKISILRDFFSQKNKDSKENVLKEINNISTLIPYLCHHNRIKEIIELKEILCGNYSNDIRNELSLMNLTVLDALIYGDMDLLKAIVFSWRDGPELEIWEEREDVFYKCWGDEGKGNFLVNKFPVNFDWRKENFESPGICRNILTEASLNNSFIIFKGHISFLRCLDNVDKETKIVAEIFYTTKDKEIKVDSPVIITNIRRNNCHNTVWRIDLNWETNILVSNLTKTLTDEEQNIAFWIRIVIGENNIVNRFGHRSEYGVIPRYLNSNEVNSNGFKLISILNRQNNISLKVIPPDKKETIKNLKQKLKTLDQKEILIERLICELNSLKKSNSWKVTKPLRSVGRVVRRLLK